MIDNNASKYPVSSKLVTKAMGKVYMDNPTPDLNNVFKAFLLCPYDKLKVIWLGQDPYPQHAKATGLAFANYISANDRYSPSLEVLRNSLRESLAKQNKKGIFDPTLESWAKQGVLLLNSALTTRVGQVGSHVMVWRPVISSFLSKLSWIKPDLVYILSGSTANSFKPYIGDNIGVISTVHPSLCARTKTPFPDVFTEVNSVLNEHGKEEIIWA